MIDLKYIKNINGVETKYYLQGTNIIAEEKNGQTIHYIYNEQNQLVGFEHQSNKYFYVRDLLGVIRNIIDVNGKIVVTYKYDAWGNHKVYDSSNAGNTRSLFIGNINPFRYKGYYYDLETVWYYLQSRYYSPLLSRFINMDHTKYLEPGNTNGVNLFGYCGNNPVMYADPSGKFAILALLIGVGISFVFEVVEDALDGNGIDHDFNEYLGAGISGLLGSMGGGLIAQTTLNVAGGMIDAWLSGDLEKNGFLNTLGSVALSSTVSFGIGVATKRTASSVKASSLKKLSNNISNKKLGSMGVTAKIGSNAAKAQGGLASIIRKQSNWVGNIIYETVGSSIAGGLSSIGYGQVSNHFGWNF